MDPNGSQLSTYLLHRFAILCKAFMLVNSKETSHAVATDVVDWALQQKIINLDQRRNAVRAQNDVDIRGHTQMGCLVCLAGTANDQLNTGFLAGQAPHAQGDCTESRC